MFLDFYQMRQQPFGVTPDPAYLYLSPTHRDALSSLSTGIREGRGFLALIAQPGMGKTTLLYQLLEELRDTACTAFLFQTQCDSREFFQYLLAELRIDSSGMDLVTMHNKLNEVLFAEMIAGRRFVLVVDEAQNLSDSVLETVRMLSNFETSHTKLLQIVLAGQPQLAEKLAQPQLAQLRQRIATLAQLHPLSEAETANYIGHRLNVAGYTGGSLFTPGALIEITKQSQGIPRSINNLCHNVLTQGQSEGALTVDAALVRRVASKMDIGSVGLLHSAAAAGANASQAREVTANGAMQPEKQEPVLALSYEASKRKPLHRWDFRAMLLAALVLGGGLIFGLSKLMEPSQARAASLKNRAAQSAASFAEQYSADPEEHGTQQILTVAAMPQQTLRDISLLYVGRYDSELLKQIRILNPELDDSLGLKPGQLIRLPLAPGSFQKGQELSAQ